ncbi:ferritin-like domain-containing protein [Clostridium guangxiense]|uniref:ferritin-like domain-containing protein n=1 Tax=Clostridium guangxiense TaxID=1662055 RepID=UPI001E2F4CA0|nr:ferritin-like domain-containing protein [Clostridium guangxiense]MCD2346510.1 ferritin-like domain-containing protein [Clostridium guangxiense]
MTNIKCLVCGKYVNENNYNFNNEAFIDKNKKNSIIYCPFCGASSIYFSESREVYNVNPKEFDESTLKIVDHAVKLEVFNGDFYLEAAKMCKSDKVEAMFKSLSNIEYEHAKIHMRLGGFNNKPVLRNMDYSNYDTDEKLLKAASMREEHAVKYYNKYSKEINNEVLSKVFKILRDVEKIHIQLTLDEI